MEKRQEGVLTIGNTGSLPEQQVFVYCIEVLSSISRGTNGVLGLKQKQLVAVTGEEG